MKPAKSQIVLFTDGYAPDPRKKEVGPSRIGFVTFAREAQRAAQAKEIIPKETIEK